MEIRAYLITLRRWIYLIILGAVVAGAIAFVYSISQQPVYRATSTLLVNEGEVDSSDYNALRANAFSATSYVQRLRNREVLEEAARRVGVDLTAEKIRGNMNVNAVANTELIRLSIENTDPNLAMQLANEIPTVFAERNQTQQLARFANSKTTLEAELQQTTFEIERINAQLEALNSAANTDETRIGQLREDLVQFRNSYSRVLESLEQIRVTEARSLSNIIVDELAVEPSNAIRPRTTQNTVIAIIIGALFATGIVFVIEYLDDTIQTPDDIKAIADVTTLGTIPQMQAIVNEGDSLITLHKPRSPISEAYRQIRTNVQFAGVSRGLNSVLVTSPNPGEGKSTTIGNLAITLAQTGKKVLIVDSDLRRPRLHRLFDIPNHFGLSNIILGDTPDELGYPVPKIPNLRVIPAGPLPPNPSELLQSARMREVVRQFEEQADYVLFDTPPILAVADSTILSQVVNTTIIVVRANETMKHALKNAFEQLQTMERFDVAGVVLNDLSSKSRHYYYYYGKYGYGKYANEAYGDDVDDGGNQIDKKERKKSDKSGRKKSRRQPAVSSS